MYTDVFQLAEPPFQLTPDARFWFESRTHKKAMAYLGYGLAQGEGFIVVTGEVGAGKSTLVAHLLATIDKARLNAVSIVSSQVEGDDMLRLVAQRLGLDTTGVSKAALLDRVENALAEVVRSGRRTLLIVDEAQTLGATALEELRMLSNFQSDRRPLVQILLTGQPEFRDRLAAGGLEQLRQRVVATHHLDPMEASEIEHYMVHRLSLVGWQGRPHFDASAFGAIYGHSEGVPRRINQLANRLLLHAAVEQRDAIDARAVDTVAADMIADQPEMDEARVLPLRAVPASDPPPEIRTVMRPDNSLWEARVSVLEAQLVEQEQALRHVLTLLVDWVEREPAAPDYRSHAA